MNTPPRILIVEDEGIVAFNLQQRLVHLGYDVPHIVASGQESLDIALRSRPDLVLMDIHIEGEMDGIETALQLNRESPIPVIYLTAYSEDATLQRARQTRPYGFLIKPFSERELHATIQMALERHKVEEALSENRRLLQQATQAAGMGVMELNLTTRAIQMTPRTAELLGKRADEPLLLDDFSQCVDERDRERLTNSFRTSLEHSRAFSEEFRIVSPERSGRWVKLDASALPGERVSGVLRDITESKLAEIRLRKLNEGLEALVSERTNELHESLKELESYSYSVAHDLRSPLRAISGLSTILMENHKEQLNTEGAELLTRISDKTKEMGNLIDAMLNLSRISKTMPMMMEVDLSLLASEIIEQQQEATPERTAEVTISPNMKAECDVTLVRSVLDNLLRNAWKFSARQEVTRIEVGHTAYPGEAVFFVRDNGCGFDMAQADQLFSPFKRLHSQREYKGTGVGLSIVQRIAARHGGRVWAEAARDQGATFFFTLAAPQADAAASEALPQTDNRG
jgi:signal transduction histidine kinase